MAGMPYFDTAREPIFTGLVGTGWGNEARDTLIMKVAKAGYERANCFCPRMGDLVNLVSPLNRYAADLGQKRSDLLHNQIVPSIPSIRDAVQGEPVSLKVMVKILSSVGAIAAHGGHFPHHAAIAAVSTVVAKNAVIPSFWYANPTELKQIRVALGFADDTDIMRYSSAVFVHEHRFADTVNTALVAGNMEAGYKNKDTAGHYTFTEALARSYYRGVSAIAAAQTPKVAIPEFKHLFKLSENLGPRNGHSTQAMRPSDGNIIEHHKEYASVPGLCEEHLMLVHDTRYPNRLTLKELFAALKAEKTLEELQAQANARPKVSGADAAAPV